MKRFIHVQVLFAAVVGSCTAASEAVEPPPVLQTGNGSVQFAVRANADFGLDLYHQIAKENKVRTCSFHPTVCRAPWQ